MAMRFKTILLSTDEAVDSSEARLDADVGLPIFLDVSADAEFRLFIALACFSNDASHPTGASRMACLG